MSRLERAVWIVVLGALVSLFACALYAQDEALAPDGTSANDGSTSCDTNPHLKEDDDPDSPDGDAACSAGTNCTGWCAADNNNTSWTMTLTMPSPSSSLDTTTDAQEIKLYVKSFDEGQSADPTIRVDIYDGTGCADIHESGAETTLTDAGFPATYTELWTAGGISAAADICVLIACTKTGGAPGARNACDIDAIEWNVTWAAAATRSRAHVIGAP